MNTIVKYEIDKFGVIHQLNPNPFVYDKEYVDIRYGESLKDKIRQMSYLRYAYLIGIIKTVPTSILDVGYGDGDFLKVCSQSIINCFGNDLFDDHIPDKCTFVNNFENSYDVITFFDSLEHFSDINFVKKLKCNHIMISVPWCVSSVVDDNFINWKHRRPNEHLHHFDNVSLNNFMEDCGYTMLEYSNIEDMIRIPENLFAPNILTAIFEKN